MHKVVILGPPEVGKTTFFKRCCNPENFDFNIPPPKTEFTDTKIMIWQGVKFELVDTVGNAVFADITSAGNIFHNVSMFLIMFNANSVKTWEDTCKLDRFENIKGQLLLKRSCVSKVHFIMVGTKDDLPARVSEDAVMDFVDKAKTVEDGAQVHYFRLSRKFFRCSSKEGGGVIEILNYIVAQLQDKDTFKPVHRDPSIVRLTESTTHPHKKSCACASSSESRDGETREG